MNNQPEVMRPVSPRMRCLLAVISGESLVCSQCSITTLLQLLDPGPVRSSPEPEPGRLVPDLVRVSPPECPELAECPRVGASHCPETETEAAQVAHLLLGESQRSPVTSVQSCPRGLRSVLTAATAQTNQVSNKKIQNFLLS